jgi:5'-nucleotidase
MRILISNDDGVNTLGIRLLAEWAKKLGEVVVVAPKIEQSAKSHAIEIVHPIEIKEVDFIDGVRAYSVDSTPADCVRFGLLGLGEKFDLVLSGINKGINVGDDIVYSGTVGAAEEAAKLGVKSIAFSSEPNDQAIAATYLDQVYDYIVKNKLLEINDMYNINIPAKVKDIRITYQGTAYYSDRFRKLDGDMYIQEGEPIPDVMSNDSNRDTVAFFEGYISITPLQVSRTNMEIYRRLTQGK